jgi:hypothetical protein
MISDIASYLRFFDSVRRRTERDVTALPPEAAAWRPPPGETAWTIGDIVGHIGATRLYFASAYRGEGWIATPPDLDRGISGRGFPGSSRPRSASSRCSGTPRTDGSLAGST